MLTCQNVIYSSYKNYVEPPPSWCLTACHRTLTRTCLICLGFCWGSISREFPGDSVVRLHALTAERPGSVPGWGTDVPSAAWHGQKTPKETKKQEAFIKVMLYANFRRFSFLCVFDVRETRKNLGPGHLVLVLALLLAASTTLPETWTSLGRNFLTC